MFQYMWGIRGGAHAMTTFGNVMHRTIKEFARGMQQAQQSLPRGSRSRSTIANGPPPDFRTIIRKRNIARRAANSSRLFIAPTARRRPTCCTRKNTFELPLEHDVIVTGRMDQVNRIDGKRSRDRRLQNGKAEGREGRDERFAAQRLRAGGGRSARPRSRAAGLLQSDDQ